MREKKRNWYINQRKYHFIYKTTCKVNGKFYYGMHSTDDLNDGYIGSGTYLAKAIRRYGCENFSFEILEHLPDRESLRKRETELITEEILNDPMCMNLRLGGEGGWDHCNKPGNWLGISSRTNSKVQRRISQKKTEKLNNDPVFRKKYQESKRQQLLGNTLWVGRSHSAETKKKMSLSKKITSKGDRNSQFGTFWVCNQNGAIKIKYDQLEFYLNSGWVRGRKFNTPID